MALSKRLRYEILRRDNHACTYCGATAPDVKLTVDHVVPTALGGSDEPSNLTTACAACNGGKSASSPDAAVVDSVQQDALRWSQAMKVAAEQQRQNLQALTQYQQSIYSMWDNGLESYLPTDWESSAERWFSMGLALEEVEYAMRIAFNASHVKAWDMWKYACGVIYKRLREQQEIASRIVAEPDEALPEFDQVEAAAFFAGDAEMNEINDHFNALSVKYPEVGDFAATALTLVRQAAMALPEADPSSAWYGFGDYRRQFGEGIKHKWLRVQERFPLTDEESFFAYQYIVRGCYDYWSMVVTNGS